MRIQNGEQEENSKMDSIGLLVAGAVLAVAALWLGYAPISAPAWWGLNFDVFWFGVADVLIGASLLV